MRIFIDNREVKDYVTNEISLNYDTLADTFSLSRPFFEHWEKNRRDNNESYLMFKPLEFYDVRITDNLGNTLLTGYLLNHNFTSEANGNNVTLSGYSKTGVLTDCVNVQEALKAAQQVDLEQSVDFEINEETDIEALHETATQDINVDDVSGESTCFDGLSLLELATKLVSPFGISIKVDDIVKDKVNEKYEQSTAYNNETVGDYLSKLATLKNVVLRSTPNGELLFTQLNPNGRVVLSVKSGDGKTTRAGLSVNGQKMHSIIYMTGAAPLSEDLDENAAKTGEAVKIINPLIKKYRPFVKEQKTEQNSVVDPAKAMLANELMNISLELELQGFEMIDNASIRTGDIIEAQFPDIYIYHKTKFMVRSIKLFEDANGKKTSLSCILPQAITGENPDLIFR